MSIYKKRSTTQGSWVKASDIESGTTAQIVSETNPEPSQFLDKNGNPKTQDVAKVLFKGFPESVKVALNCTTINGLVDAFGEDSKNWQHKDLIAETEKVRVAGKAVTALYLIPEGYEKVDNEEGFAEIRKKDGQDASEEIEVPGGDDIPVIED